MKTIGKILFFNETEGSGILITANIGKIAFSILDWDDFNLMPAHGQEVSFNFQDNKALNILVNSLVKNSSPALEKPYNLSIHKEEEKEDIQRFSENETYASEDIEEILEPRTTDISLTLSLPAAVENYFSLIKLHINNRASYKKRVGRLDYLVAKRFIWTTFNNLVDIDSHLLTPKVQALTGDLKIMGSVYDDYNVKVRNPSLAFKEVFLSCQTEYEKLRVATEEILEKLNFLKNNEKKLAGLRKAKKEEVEEKAKSEEFNLLNAELKALNGTYVDVIHSMAQFDERHKHDLQLLHNFEQEYRDDFYTIFAQIAKEYKVDLLEILDSQAYVVDHQLWQQAKISKAIKAHFKESSIIGELNTKTYLKYYLDSFDSAVAKGETKQLFELYEHLLITQKEYILVVVNSVSDAMDYTSSIKRIDKSYHVKSFVDPKNAIKWAMNNTVKILIVESVLQGTNATTFLNIYHKHIFSRPKIILIGDKPTVSSSEYSISMLLAKNAPPKVVADSVKTAFNKDKSL